MNAPISLAINLMLLATEAQHAAQMRLHRLGFGGAAAADEVVLMVREKVDAFAVAISSMMAGKSLDNLVGDYRTIVQANIESLTQVDNVAPTIADVSGHDIEEGRS